MSNFQKMTAREAYAAYFSGSVLVNVTENPKFNHKDLDVNNILHIPFSELPNRISELPKDRNVVLVSGVGNKSKYAATLLMENGFENVAIIEGGMQAWEEEGLPVNTEV